MTPEELMIANVALSVFKGKKKPNIICMLYKKGPMRFNELQKSLAPISKKVLTDHLRELEKQGMVTRTVFPEVPPHVEYSLTELGQSISPIHDTVQQWQYEYARCNNCLDDYDPNECSELVFETISDKWKPEILRCLDTDTKRFGEIKKDLHPISQKVLTEKLRNFEEHGIIERIVYNEIPPKVEYRITPFGHTMKPIFDALIKWGDHYIEARKKNPSQD